MKSWGTTNAACLGERMVIDTSALIAIFDDEPERPYFNELIAGTPVCRISAANYVECAIVLETRRGRTALHDLLVYMTRAGIEIDPVTADHAELAVDAYRTYGRGNHRAALNFGDAFSYALSIATGEPLLFKGSDFALTDVVPAIDL